MSNSSNSTSSLGDEARRYRRKQNIAMGVGVFTIPAIVVMMVWVIMEAWFGGTTLARLGVGYLLVVASFRTLLSAQPAPWHDLRRGIPGTLLVFLANFVIYGWLP